MRGDGLGDALAPGQARLDELPGVALVDLRAGRADVLAAVAARGQQHPVRLAGGVVDQAGVAGGQVDGADMAAQPDRLAAMAGVLELAFPPVEVGAADPVDEFGTVLAFPPGEVLAPDLRQPVVGGLPQPQTGSGRPGAEGIVAAAAVMRPPGRVAARRGGRGGGSRRR